MKKFLIAFFVLFIACGANVDTIINSINAAEDAEQLVIVSGTKGSNANFYFYEKNSDGELMRPHIVWFGEAVPAITEASRLVRSADIFAVIGSSLVVYPAAGLVNDLRSGTKSFLIDPAEVQVPSWLNFRVIKEIASKGTAIMREELLNS